MIISNDVQACYDRIVLWISSFVLQRIGLNKKVTFPMTNTLLSETHDINTTFGILIEKYFQITPSHQGSGQSN